MAFLIPLLGAAGAAGAGAGTAAGAAGAGAAGAGAAAGAAGAATGAASAAGAGAGAATGAGAAGAAGGIAGLLSNMGASAGSSVGGGMAKLFGAGDKTTAFLKDVGTEMGGNIKMGGDSGGLNFGGGGPISMGEQIGMNQMQQQQNSGPKKFNFSDYLQQMMMQQ